MGTVQGLQEGARMNRFWHRHFLYRSSRQANASISLLILVLGVPLALLGITWLVAGLVWGLTSHSEFNQIAGWTCEFQRNKQGKNVNVGPNVVPLGHYEAGVLSSYVIYQLIELATMGFYGFKRALS